MSDEKVRGVIFNIQRFSLHDGPGIRTTVFFKGCNLRCAWCHNPESFIKEPQVSIDRKKENGADPDGAKTTIGKQYTPREVMDVVVKDRAYYERSDGGVTFSGGEPTYQYKFLLELVKLAKQEKMHVCLETNGMVAEKQLIEISQYIDLFLFDFKHYDDAMHEKYIGASNQPILKNLELLNRLEKPLILRCPIIPGVNDVPEHFEAIKALRNKCSNIQNVELMPYHDIGVSKWENIGYDYTLKETKPPRKEQVEEWNKLIN